MTTLPEVFAVIVAVLGTGAGIAALLKVSSDNAKTVTDAAVDVVELLRQQVERQERRVQALERNFETFDKWADKVINLMERLVSFAPSRDRTQYDNEVELVKITRPRRHPEEAT